MILLGAIANSAAVLVGGAVGLFAGKLLSPRIQKAVTSALALLVMSVAIPGIDDSQKAPGPYSLHGPGRAYRRAAGPG